jgi:hypothetical protein
MSARAAIKGAVEEPCTVTGWLPCIMFAQPATARRAIPGLLGSLFFQIPTQPLLVTDKAPALITKVMIE